MVKNKNKNTDDTMKLSIVFTTFLLFSTTKASSKPASIGHHHEAKESSLGGEVALQQQKLDESIQKTSPITSKLQLRTDKKEIPLEAAAINHDVSSRRRLLDCDMDMYMSYTECRQIGWPYNDYTTVYDGCIYPWASSCNECYIYRGDNRNDRCNFCSVCDEHDDTVASYDCSNFISDDACSKRNCNGVCYGDPGPTPNPTPPQTPKPTTSDAPGGEVEGLAFPECHVYWNVGVAHWNCFQSGWPLGFTIFYSGCLMTHTSSCRECYIFREDDPDDTCNFCNVCKTADDSVAAYDCSNFVSDNPCSKKSCNGACYGEPAPTTKPTLKPTSKPTTVLTTPPTTSKPTVPVPTTAEPKPTTVPTPTTTTLASDLDGTGREESTSGAESISIAFKEQAVACGALMSLVGLLKA